MSLQMDPEPLPEGIHPVNLVSSLVFFVEFDS